MEELTQETFKEKTKTNAIIDFWAPWCGPCKMQGPIFEAVAAENSKLFFGKVNVDEQAQLAGAHGVRSIPTIIFIKDGKVVNEHAGLMDKNTLQSKIDEVFS